MERCCSVMVRQLRLQRTAFGCVTRRACLLLICFVQECVAMIFSPKKSSICVVDPRPADYDAVVARAVGEDAEVVFAGSAREALRLRPEAPEMWVVNCELPDLSGLELLDMLRGRFPQTPVCMVSDEYRPEDELAARSRGASMYLCKPLVAEWLLEPRMSVCH